MSGWVCEVRRDQPHTTRLVPAVGEALGKGQVRARVERFSVSSNNATYARTGDVFGYWDLFPAAPQWGRVPAWGVLDIVESRIDEIPCGTRFFGLVPMAEMVELYVDRVGSTSCRARASDRAVHAAYHHYTLLDRDPLHAPGTEDLQCALRPQLLTGFTLAAETARRPDVQQVVLTGASSKTAVATAYALGPQVRTIGLTRATGRDAVSALQVYSAVGAYEAVADIPVAPTVLLDLAGSTAVVAAVRERLGERLMETVSIGDLASAGPARGREEWYFSPSSIARELSTDGEFGRRHADTWHRFAGFASAAFRVEHVDQPSAVAAAFRAVLEGTVPVRDLLVVNTIG